MKFAFVVFMFYGAHSYLISKLNCKSLYFKLLSSTNLINIAVPDKEKFLLYYNEVVKDNFLDKKLFLQYEEVSKLLSDNLIVEDDVESLWASAVGDSPGLDQDEAYEMLCMVNDLPDPEDVEYFSAEFKSLSKGGEVLSFPDFLQWADVQNMLADKVLNMEGLIQLWRSVAGDLNTSISISMFRKLNDLVDDFLDNDNFRENENASIFQSERDSTLENFFDLDSRKAIQLYFENSKGKNDKIYFNTVSNWEEVKWRYEEGMTIDDLTHIWNNITNGDKYMNYNEFLQFNVNIDLKIEDIENINKVKKEELLDKKFYIDQFKEINGDTKIMPFEVLMSWKEISDLIKEGIFTENQLQSLFDALPQEPMGLPSTRKGINLTSFIKLNEVIDSFIDSKNIESNKLGEKLSSIPNQLSSDSISADDTTISESELELMKLLDGAENLLNSGSFDEFDKLIGDEGDPRIIAKSYFNRSSSDNSILMKYLFDLIDFSKKQNRCGMDVPSEFDISIINDLYQSVLHSAPQLVLNDISELKMNLCGQWKLLYTNSEMFRFYNGITGFPNVFPATKFKDLVLEYTSDGFLSELKYLEMLENPLGKLEATVFGNWDLVKETSFMTNQKSLIIRSYCTKVTAGPLTYEAQENWKSLRTLSMNEIIYLDDNHLILRNCGALKIFFVLEKLIN